MDDRPSPAVAHAFGPFITWLAKDIADGVREIHTSRRARKRLPALRLRRRKDVHPLEAGVGIRHAWTSFWAPERLAWWIAVLFMIGASLFAIGGARAAWPGATALRWFDPAALGVVFFVGSLFFTAAGYLQFYEALNNDVEHAAAGNHRAAPPRPRYFGWRPRNLGYLSSLSQFAGTLLFNLNTIDGMIEGLNWKGEDLLVWTPNVLGCVCFLVASQLAVMEFSHRWFAFRPGQLPWWIVAVNMLGSILFMASAVGSFMTPANALVSSFTAYFGTFAGALCFLVGAYLLIPEQFEINEAKA